MTSVAPPDRDSLSSDLNQFLVELSIALHQHAMYPSGHPTIGPAIEAVSRRASGMLKSRPSIAFGVARRQLIIEGVATDADHPVPRRLAEGLHRHHFGAVSITRGLEEGEIAEALRALAAEPQQDGPLALTQTGRVGVWPHLKLHPLSFDGLALVGDAPLSTDGADGANDTQGVEMWVGLARAALSIAEADDLESARSTPALVAQAIDDHPDAEAYDQVIIGFLLQIARELRSTSGIQGEALRKKTSSLIAALKPETLRRLVDMGGDLGQQGEFVRDATEGMAVTAVLQIVHAAAETNGQTISDGLVRMLAKLAAHAEAGPEQARTRADTELREQVMRLVSDWHLEDPTPEAYSRVLQHLATTAQDEEPGTGGDPTTDSGTTPLRVVLMSLESGVFGPLVEKALTRVVDGGQASTIHTFLKTRPRGADDIAEAMLSTLAQAATLRTLVGSEPFDVADLDPLVPHMDVAGCEVLLDALAASELRVTRRGLLDVLARMDLDLGDVIAARLEDERWYVQRNMLVLLYRRGYVPEGLALTPWTSHPDARVRVEALRVQLRMPNEREPALLTALADPEPDIVTLGLTAVQQECPTPVARRVAEIALQPGASEPIRFLAATALGHMRQRHALVTLLRLSDGGRSVLGRQKLPPPTAVLVASVRALAEQWAADPRAALILAAAAQSSDAKLRQAAQGY